MNKNTKPVYMTPMYQEMLISCTKLVVYYNKLAHVTPLVEYRKIQRVFMTAMGSGVIVPSVDDIDLAAQHVAL